MSFEIGTAVGPYKIESKLGQGGMATVYKAYHAKLDRHVAIKVLHAAFKDNEPFLKRFAREAKVVARLEHAHIVPIYDFADHDGYPYLVMRLIDGETLKDRLSSGQISRPEIMRIATAIAQALDYAHTQGVLHRDIKPSNILLTERGGVYITDFGLARITQAGESTLSQDMIMGTPQYISPEQAKGSIDIDGRTDIYSFGIVLFEMVSGRVPFQSETSYSIIHSQIFDSPPLPSSFNEKVSPHMESVLLKVLSKEPDGRYDTANELVHSFAQAAAEMPTDMAPIGVNVLPDYTPPGMTRMSAPDVPPAEATPSLPDLSEAPSSEITAVSPPPKKERNTAVLIGLGILAGMFICGGLFFVINRIQKNRQLDSSPIAVQPTDTVPTLEAVNDQPETNTAQTDTANQSASTNEPPSPTPESQEDDNSPPTQDNNPPTPPDQPPGPGEGGIFPEFDIELPERVRPTDELEQLLEENASSQLLQLELAAAYVRDGRPDDARAILSELFPHVRMPGGFVMLSEQLLEREQYEMAELVLEEGWSRFQNDHITQQMLLMTYILNGKSGSSIQQYMGALKPYRPNPTTNNISEAYLEFERGNQQHALEIIDRTFNDGNIEFAADFLFIKGQLLKAMNQPSEALPVFRQALDFMPPQWLATLIEAEIVELEG
ncbi:MAG: protein kinase [Chloroflexi bacterium]|nr:protein kinase [Chloroflexota bacterium]